MINQKHQNIHFVSSTFFFRIQFMILHLVHNFESTWEKYIFCLYRRGNKTSQLAWVVPFLWISLYTQVQLWSIATYTSRKNTLLVPSWNKISQLSFSWFFSPHIAINFPEFALSYKQTIHNYSYLNFTQNEDVVIFLWQYEMVMVRIHYLYPTFQ